MNALIESFDKIDLSNIDIDDLINDFAQMTINNLCERCVVCGLITNNKINGVCPKECIYPCHIACFVRWIYVHANIYETKCMYCMCNFDYQFINRISKYIECKRNITFI